MADPALRCPSCAAENALDARFCNQCTAPLISTAGAQEDAERKQVSVLFCDVSGYTALSERLDPEETREIMGRIFEVASEIVARYEGRIEKFIGDAIMAIFGVPVAHEDDPVRAVRAALELREAVAAMSPSIEARAGAPISVHCGVNTGVVVTGELRFDRGTAGPLGDTINLASRLMSDAPTGEIWIGPETQRLVARFFDLEDLGRREFKGKSEPVSVARVRGLAGLETRDRGHFTAEFIGRQAEIGALLGAAERMRDGEPSAFGIRGDAGTGKTRLVDELRTRLGNRVRWIEGRAYPYAESIPFAPILDLLNRSWSIEESDTPAAVRAKLEAGVAGLLDDQAPSVLPLFLHLYDMEQRDDVIIDRETFQDRLLEAMRELTGRLAARGPLVVCMQDLHWADASTTALLRGLVEAPGGPMLFVANFRPGYEAPAAMQVLELSELSSRQTGELLASLLDAEPPEVLARFIEQRSDGNPFYVEEVVNSLVETGVLVRGKGAWSLERPLTEAGVPATVRGVIAARIDRLQEGRKRVLCHAAVIGREFMHSVVAEVTEAADDLDPSLGDLVAGDLIRPLEPDVAYIFKHALTQEVAYDGLLKSERRKLHERVAYAMEAVLADRIPEFVETLAYHFERGGVDDRAAHYLIEAGKKCVGRYALAEADDQFRRAYDLLSPEGRAPMERRLLCELLVQWSWVLYYQSRIGDWIRLLKRHLPDAEGCGDQRVLAMYLGWLGNVQCFHGDPDGSLENLARAHKLAQAEGDRTAVGHAVAWRVNTLMMAGRIRETLEGRADFDVSERERLERPYAWVKFFGAYGLAQILDRRPDDALATAHELITFGRRTGNARALAMGYGVETFTRFHWLDLKGAVESGALGIENARDPVFGCFNAVGMAYAHATALDVEGAGRVVGEWLPERERLEDRWFAGLLYGPALAVDVGAGRLSEGMRTVIARVAEQRRSGMHLVAHFIELAIAFAWVSTARFDLNPGVGALLRNPWFTVTQAPFAARKASALIARLRDDLVAMEAPGQVHLLDFAEARLLSRQRRKDEARAKLDRVRQFLVETGAPNPEPPIVAELAAELG